MANHEINKGFRRKTRNKEIEGKYKILQNRKIK